MAINDYYYWRFKKYPIEIWGETSKYYGLRCKLLAVGKKNNILIEFDDGKRFITNRRGIKKIKDTRQLELFKGV